MPEPALKPQSFAEIISAKTINYLSLPCVVGHEQFFFNSLYNEFKSLGLQVCKYEGLLEIRGSKPLSGMICAHIDRHGLISIGHGEYVYAAQYVKEIKYGQNNRASQKEIASITKRFEGESVFAYNPHTGERLGSGIIKTCDPWLLQGDALFEIEGLNKVELGFPLAYARTARIEGGFLKGQIDNAVSIATIYTLFKNGFQGTALLTTEEEIGKSWTHIAAYLVESEIKTRDIIVIDTSPYANPEPIDKGMIIFRNRDMTEQFNGGLVTRLKERAEAINIPYQVKDEIWLAQGRTVDQLGSTELGRLIQGTKNRWSGATVQIPTLAYHTSNETTSMTALDNYYAFLTNIFMEQPLGFEISIERLNGR
jgi:putative aminopeptidase FrvX